MNTKPIENTHIPVLIGKLHDGFVAKDGRTLTGSPVEWFSSLTTPVGDARDVPCGSCNACCRDGSTTMLLSGDDVSQLKTRRLPNGKGRALRKRKDGSCVHLVDGTCSVRTHRPAVCKAFDCRDMVFCGILPDSPMGVALAEKWVVELPSCADIELRNKLKAAVRVIFEQYPKMPVPEIVHKALMEVLPQYNHHIKGNPEPLNVPNTKSKGTARKSTGKDKKEGLNSG